MLLSRTASHRAHLRSHSGRNAGVALAHSPNDTRVHHSTLPLQDVAARKPAVATLDQSGPRVKGAEGSSGHVWPSPGFVCEER